MDTKEMLEFAAKACGAEIIGYRGTDAIYGMPTETDDGTEYARWAPWDDDGDCFRMECQLGIDVEWSEICVWVDQEQKDIRNYADFDDHNNDKAAARRMASTRVAAEIGRGME